MQLKQSLVEDGADLFKAFQVDGNFANRKLNELSNAELAAFEKRLANAEPQQGITDPNSGTGAMNG
jgi:hypothetical protein